MPDQVRNDKRAIFAHVYPLQIPKILLQRGNLSSKKVATKRKFIQNHLPLIRVPPFGKRGVTGDLNPDQAEHISSSRYV
jgi:hypothetical protein